MTLVENSGNSLRDIVEQVIKINALISDMTVASEQQSTGVQEVNTAVSQMDQVTQQNAAMVEETTAAARSLAGETVELSRLVSHFNIGKSDKGANVRPLKTRAA